MSGFFFFLTNACTLLSLCYLVIRIQSKTNSYDLFIAPFLAGAAAILFMLQPLPVSGIAPDLRFVPLVMVGLRFGYPSSLLATILPTLYYFFSVSSAETIAVIQSLIIPAFLGTVFHRKYGLPGYTIISLHNSWKISGSLFMVQLGFGLAARVPAKELVVSSSVMLMLSVLVLAFLIALNNEESRSWGKQRKLELQANQDSLTGLPNLRSFMKLAGESAKHTPVAILMIDVDNFKAYNDRWGHLQGDLLLRQVGHRLMERIGEQDYIARYGGEEFIILSHQPHYVYLSRLARRLCEDITLLSSPSSELHSNERISISIGISISSGPGPLEKTISEADQALYASKKSGKNRFTFYSS